MIEINRSQNIYGPLIGASHKHPPCRCAKIAPHIPAVGRRLSAHWENRNLSVYAENRAPEIVGEHCKKQSYWKIEIEKKGTKAKEIMKHLHQNSSQPIPLLFIFLFVLPSSSLSRNIGADFFGFMYAKMPTKFSANGTSA